LLFAERAKGSELCYTVHRYSCTSVVRVKSAIEVDESNVYIERFLSVNLSSLLHWHESKGGDHVGKPSKGTKKDMRLSQNKKQKPTKKGK